MIERALRRHLELWEVGHDDPSVKDEWLALFAPDCTVEEPVGSRPRAGMQSQGWDMGHSNDRRVHLEPVAVIPSPDGREAATVIRIRLVTTDGEAEFQPIGFWTGTADGRIQSSRIFGVSQQMGPGAWASAE
jgi:ketosteroid isomerase-like protein